MPNRSRLIVEVTVLYVICENINGSLPISVVKHHFFKILGLFLLLRLVRTFSDQLFTYNLSNNNHTVLPHAFLPKTKIYVIHGSQA